MVAEMLKVLAQGNVKALPGYLFFLPLVFVLFWASYSDVLAFLWGFDFLQHTVLFGLKVNHVPGRVAESPLKRVVIFESPL